VFVLRCAVSFFRSTLLHAVSLFLFYIHWAIIVIVLDYLGPLLSWELYSYKWEWHCFSMISDEIWWKLCICVFSFYSNFLIMCSFNRRTEGSFANFLPTRHPTRRLTQAVNLRTCIWEAPFSNLGRDTDCPKATAGFEVFTAMVMKSIIFWDATPCSPSFSRRFGGTYRLHRQGRRNKFSKNQLASRWQAVLLRNVGWNSTDYTASYPRRWYSSYPKGFRGFPSRRTEIVP
jgi:hypothetical protein